jgi:serine phosphatase RsbU (regulator of sigma subunit)/Tfp pilus assembly protein PilF
MRFLLLSICLLFIQSFSYSTIDSLKSVLSTLSDTSKVDVYNEISIEICFDDPEQGLMYADSALFLGKKINYKAGIARAYKYKGISFFYNEKFKEALSEYRQSLVVYSEIQDNQGITSACDNMGQVYWILAQYDDAFTYFSKSLDIKIQKRDSSGMAGSYNKLGVVFYSQGNFEKAIEYYMNALKINEELNLKYNIAISYDNLAGIYREQGKYDKALDNYLKSVAIQNELDEEFEVLITYSNIGGVYQMLKEFDKAIVYFNKSLEIANKVDDKRSIGLAYNNLGGVYSDLAKENPDTANYLFSESIVYFKRGLRLNENIGDLESVAISNRGLGTAYLYLGDFNEALKYLTEVEKIGIEIGAPDVIRDANEFLSKVYNELGMYKKAYESHVTFKEMFDNLRNDENVELITQMSMQYDFDKKQEIQKFEQLQRELEYEAELKRQRIVRYSIISVLLIVIAFAVYAYKNFKQKQKDNILLAEQKEEIEHQKEEITDSIKYAMRIQQAVVPSPEKAKEILPEHFILWRPRDIVSGDFWWMTEKDGKVVIVAADCTGHGVPGAFMSMLGVSFLNEIVNRQTTPIANLILNDLRASVKTTLKQTGKEGEAKDGMDLALVILDKEKNTIQYSGAYNPLYLLRNGELIETKADKNPIGIFIKEKDSFTNHDIQLQPGDTFYIFSDGFVDQFGGEKNMKFKSRRYKELLVELQEKSMEEQGEILDKTVDEWRGDIPQVDDIIIVGVRV